jgi:hypothetical protein
VGGWGLGTGNSSQQQDLFNLMGSMYASVVFVGVNNSSSVQPVVAVERTVFYREREAGMYSSFPYSFAQVIKNRTDSFPFDLFIYSLIKYNSILPFFIYPRIFVFWTTHIDPFCG